MPKTQSTEPWWIRILDRAHEVITRLLIRALFVIVLPIPLIMNAVQKLRDRRKP